MLGVPCDAHVGAHLAPRYAVQMQGLSNYLHAREEEENNKPFRDGYGGVHGRDGTPVSISLSHRTGAGSRQLTPCLKRK